MPALGRQQKSMKLLNQPVRPALGILKPFTNRTPDLSLHTALVEATKYSVEIIIKQQPVPIENAAFLECGVEFVRDEGPDLNILAVFHLHAVAQMD